MSYVDMTTDTYLAQRLMTTAELSAFLGLSRETVQGYARNGTIPALKVGRFWRFEVENVADFLGHCSDIAERIAHIQAERHTQRNTAHATPTSG